MEGLALDLLRVSKVLIAVFGGTVIYFAYRSYAKTKSRSMLLLAVGFAFVTIGAVVEGIMFEFMNVDLVTSDTIEAASQAIGFFTIVYSLVWTKG